MKITGFPLGENYGNTFRVENGLLKAAYDQYPEFANKFGHIFYRTKFSHYIVAAEYRFVGEQSKNGPGWALRNNGIMIHCQAPETMGKDQDFPISVEVQLLGGEATDGDEHDVTRFAIRALDGLDQAVLDQDCKLVEQGLGAADRLSQIEAPATAKHAQCAEQLLPGGLKQVVAPGDRGLERAMARWCIARALRQNGQSLPQAFEQRRGRKDGDSCGG